jgi:hypothetical protein
MHRRRELGEVEPFYVAHGSQSLYELPRSRFRGKRLVFRCSRVSVHEFVIVRPVFVHEFERGEIRNSGQNFGEAREVHPIIADDGELQLAQPSERWEKVENVVCPLVFCEVNLDVDHIGQLDQETQ